MYRLLLALVIGFCFMTEAVFAVSERGQPHPILGCWYKTSHEAGRQSLSHVTFCFRGRPPIIQGSTFDADDGWDWRMTWRLSGRHRIMLSGEDGTSQVCAFRVRAARTMLDIRDCRWEGTYIRDNRVARP